jgi:hypothetical protein
MDSKTKIKELNLLNKILEESSQNISSLKDLSKEAKLTQIIKAM